MATFIYSCTFNAGSRKVSHDCKLGCKQWSWSLKGFSVQIHSPGTIWQGEDNEELSPGKTEVSLGKHGKWMSNITQRLREKVRFGCV